MGKGTPEALQGMDPAVMERAAPQLAMAGGLPGLGRKK